MNVLPHQLKSVSTMTAAIVSGLVMLMSMPSIAIALSSPSNTTSHPSTTWVSPTKDAHDAEPSAVPDAGLVVMASPYSVAETGDRFEALLTERGVTVFARIDHAAGAAGVELDLRPTEVIIFGNPRVGTPLMQCAQSMAIDLPQKLLIWENEIGDVYLGYNDPRYLASRHGITGCEEAIARVEQILMGLTNAVIAEEVESEE
ncbi:MAG: DUF302 domain-containing protein [Cyanobacteria bacterium P01_E01_bin.6]